MSLHPLHAGTSPFLWSPLPLPPLLVADHGAKYPGYSHLCTLCPSSPDPLREPDMDPHAHSLLWHCVGCKEGLGCIAAPPPPPRALGEPGPLSQVCSVGLASHAGMLSAKRTSPRFCDQTCSINCATSPHPSAADSAQRKRRARHRSLPLQTASSLPKQPIPGTHRGILSPFLGLDSALVLVPAELTQTCKREGHRLSPGNPCPAPRRLGIGSPITAWPCTILAAGESSGTTGGRALPQTCLAPGCTHLPLRPSSSQDHSSLRGTRQSQQAHCEEDEGGGSSGSGAAEGHQLLGRGAAGGR